MTFMPSIRVAALPLFLFCVFFTASAAFSALPAAEPEDSLTRPLEATPRQQAPSTQNLSQSKPVMVGDTSLTLPALDGFHELYGSNKTFDGIVEQFVTPGNRMLAVYVSDPDIAAMNADPQAGLKKYILVQTRKGDARVKDAADFDAIRDEVAKEVGDGSLKDSAEVKDEVAKASDYMHNQLGKDLQIKVGETKFLGRFVDSREALSYLLATNYGVTTPEGTKSFPIVAAMSVLTVKERALFIFVYSDYKSAADIDFATQNTKKFLDRAFVANGGAPGQVAAGSSTGVSDKSSGAEKESAGEAGKGTVGKAGSEADKGTVGEADASTPLTWATWAALIVALIAGAALGAPKLLKRLGEKDETK